MLLVGLRWAVPAFIVFSDLAIVYTLGSSVLSALYNPNPNANPNPNLHPNPNPNQVLSALLGAHRGQASVSS